MKKSTAIIVFVFADLFAAFIFYSISYKPLTEVFLAIKNHYDSLEYVITFFIGFGALGIPVAHVVGIIENYFPRYFNRAICTNVVLGAFIIPIVFGLGMGKWIRHEIIRHGYLHCESADVHMKLYQVRVYVINDGTCHRLILEEENRRLGYR